MGWKASLIIIENKKGVIDDESILNAIGKPDYKFERELTLSECIYPNDESINIGYYNGNIIIADDYVITTKTLERADKLKLTKEEKRLIEIFPNSEIVTVACHSAINYHGYSLIKDGIKKRLKTITSDTPIVEFGERFEEEIGIYKNSFERKGESYWKDEKDEEEYTEDQLMEDFAFGIAKRRLGVLLDYSDGEELMEKVTFRKYIEQNQDSVTEEEPINEKKVKWIKYGIIFLIILVWQILKRTILSK